MTPVEMIYLASLLLGGGYLAMASVLHVIGGGADHETPDAVASDAGAAPHAPAAPDADAAPDLDGDHGGAIIDHHALDRVSFLSPLVLSTLLVGFGAMGFAVQHWLTELILVSLAAAVGMGAVGGSGVWWSLNKLRAVEGSSEAVVRTLLGHTAMVSIAIPAAGLGEIVYEKNNSRFNAPARAGNGRAIPRGAQVIIGGVDGAIFLVEEAGRSRIHRLAEALDRGDEGERQGGSAPRPPEPGGTGDRGPEA